MKRVELTSEWLENWRPKSSIEVADRGCKGLVVRGGPRGWPSFHRWSSERGADGKVRRRRIRLGNWPAMTLGGAREAVHAAREESRARAATGTAVTVQALAEAYRKDILGRRDPSSAEWAWRIIKTHVLPARPDPSRLPLGEWAAAAVKPPHIAALIRMAREERTADLVDAKGRTVKRHLGGRGVARSVLHEVKALFAAAVGAGALENSPAAVLQASALGLRGSKRGRYLDAEELAALFAALDLNALLDGTAKYQKLSATTRLGIALLHYAPARSHSLIAARWEEIDLEAARWTIPVAKLKLHREDRAEARPFILPLCKTAVAILKRLLELAGKAPWVMASPRKPTAHLGSKSLLRVLARLQASGRLAFGSPLVLHDARRTWRAWAGELGVSFEIAEKSLAHALPGIADTYARAELVEQRAAAAELVGAAFDRIRLGQGALVVPIAERRPA